MLAFPAGLVGHHASPITKLYHFVDQKMTWTDAQRHCREHFDDMATVVNPEELKQLQESMIGSDNDDDSMWIGLYDDITRWSNYNQTYIMGQHYGNWAPGEPNLGAAEEICTKINQSTGQWMDVQCSNPNQVVCINGGLDLYLLHLKGCSRFQSPSSVNALDSVNVIKYTISIVFEF